MSAISVCRRSQLVTVNPKESRVESSGQAKTAGIEIQVTSFTDYTTPNTALQDGSIDANLSKYLPFLTNFNKTNGTDIVPNPKNVKLQELDAATLPRAIGENVADEQLVPISEQAHALFLRPPPPGS